MWDGDSIAEIREYRHDVLTSVRHLVFSGSELVSQQVSRERQLHPTEPVRWMTRTVHAVSEQTGRPLMLFNSAGEAVRRPQDTTLWGRTATAATGDPDLPRRREDEEADPGLLYAGQWRDAESGLYYNRFRYYEPESGMYMVSDPLGLQGGVNTYAYVPNPLIWTDPLGLAKCPHIKLANKIQERAIDGKIPKIAPGKISPKGYHGRLSEQRMQEIIKNPDGVYVSTGGNNNIIFAKDGDIVILAGNKAGAYKGQAITSYGPSGPRGESGAAIYGGRASDPGLPITDSMIINGQIPTPGGGFLPPATAIVL